MQEGLAHRPNREYSFAAMKRSINLILIVLATTPLAFAGGHGGGHYSSHSYSSRSYSSHSYGGRSYSRSYSSPSRSYTRTAPVRSYTRRDGTTVHSYRRSYPGTAPRSYHSTSRPTDSYQEPRSYRHHSTSTYGIRDARGHLRRSEAAKGAFKRQQPCPSTGKRSGACPGYVIDHRVALACGGVDDPSNMQWQTTTAARLKDKTERKGCR